MILGPIWIYFFFSLPFFFFGLVIIIGIQNVHRVSFPFDVLRWDSLFGRLSLSLLDQVRRPWIVVARLQLNFWVLVWVWIQVS